MKFIFSVLYDLLNNFIPTVIGDIVLLSSFFFFIGVLIQKKLQNYIEYEKILQKILKPQESQIKNKFSGKQRRIEIDKLYSRYNYNPIYSIRLLIPLLVQIPFFIGAYNFFQGNLNIVFTEKQLFGDLFQRFQALKSLNILPFFMLFFNVLATLINTEFESHQKIKSIIIAFLFFFLLYNAEPTLMLYWVTTNLLLFCRQLFLEVKRAKGNIIIDFLKSVGFKSNIISQSFISFASINVILNIWIGRFEIASIYGLILIVLIALHFRFNNKPIKSLSINAVTKYVLIGLSFFVHYYFQNKSLITGSNAFILFAALSLLSIIGIWFWNSLIFVILKLNQNVRVSLIILTTILLNPILVELGFIPFLYGFESLLLIILFSCFSYIIERVTLIMSVIPLVIVLFTNLFGLNNIYDSNEFGQQNNSLTSIELRSKPNTYVFVYDGLPNKKEFQFLGLSEMYNEISEFCDSQGIVIYPDTYSVGEASLESMASFLDMKNYRDEGRFPDYCKIYSDGSRTHEIFANNGYDIYSLLKPYLTGSFRTDKSNVVYEYYPKYDPEKVAELNVYSIFNMLFFHEASDVATIEGVPYDVELVQKHKQELIRLKSNRPKFVINHYGNPGHSIGAGFLRPNEQEFWEKRLDDALKLMISDIEHVNKYDPNSILVIMGDHGPKLTGRGGISFEKHADKWFSSNFFNDRLGTFIGIKWANEKMLEKSKGLDIRINQEVMLNIISVLSDDISVLKYKPNSSFTVKSSTQTLYEYNEGVVIKH